MSTQLGSAYFDLLLESLSGEIYVIREDYTIEYANNLLIKRFKGTNTNDKCYKILHNLDKPCDWCQCENLSKEQNTITCENFNKVDNRWEEITTTKILGNNKKITYLIIVKDITKRKDIEIELKTTNYKLSKKLNELNIVVNHSNVLNENLEIIVEDKTKNLKTIIKELKFKEHELILQNEELLFKEQDMNQQNKELLSKEQDMNQQSEEIISKDIEINQQNDELMSKDQEINQQNEELLSKDQEINQQKEEILSQELELLQQKEELLSREQELIQQNEELLFKDEELYQQNEEAISKDKEINQQNEKAISKEQEINNQNIKAISRDKELMQRKKQLLSKEQELKKQKEELLFNEHQLMQQKKQLLSKEQEITLKCQELEIVNIQLTKAHLNKNCFLSFMSHELRTPLNAVLGFSQSLELKYFGDLNEKQLEYVKQIHNSGEHLLSLINTILDIAKIDAGSMDLIIEEVNISNLIQEILAIMSSLFDKKQVTISLYMDDQISIIEADRVKCKQILLNLLDNAVKYSPEGGNITIRVEKLYDEKIKISITDTGIGIKEEEKESIFFEFYQSKQSKDELVKGTGLGLTLCKRLVGLHKGEIGLYSEENQGSTFWFDLPIKSFMPVALQNTSKN